MGDFIGLGLTAVGEMASGDVGDLSTTGSLLEFSTAPSAPSKFNGTHFGRPPRNQFKKILNKVSTLQAYKRLISFKYKLKIHQVQGMMKS